jgi:hypothetical protein
MVPTIPRGGLDDLGRDGDDPAGELGLEQVGVLAGGPQVGFVAGAELEAEAGDRGVA